MLFAYALRICGVVRSGRTPSPGGVAMCPSQYTSAHHTQRRRAAATNGASSALSALFVSLGSAPALFPFGGGLS